MSEEELQLRFDGPELKTHAMDVTLLAPSHLAFGEMCVEANQILNGNRASVRVLLKADISANCVTVNFQVIQSLWQAAKDLVNSQGVMSTKEILEWLGIISSGTFTTYAIGKASIKNVIEFLRWKRERKIQSAEAIPSGAVVVRVEGNNNSITIAQPAYKLATNSKVVESLKAISEPVATELGISDAVFIHDKKPQLKIDKAVAEELKAASVDSAENVQRFSAHIVTYGPILDPKSKHWKFKLNNRVENLDISRTKIAADALERGGVNVGDTYFAKIEMTEKKTKQGGYKTEYSILEVLDFIQGTRHEQTWMPFPKDKGSKTE